MQSGWRSAAEALSRRLAALSGREVRVAVLLERIRLEPALEMARLLDALCFLAVEPTSAVRLAVEALTVVLRDPGAADEVAALQRQAMEHSLAHLSRWAAGRTLLRVDGESTGAIAREQDPDDGGRKVPDYGSGRMLALGERKALARRPTRKQLAILLRDPHPSVVRILLGNPVVTEDDVVRLVARRPVGPEIVREVAAHPRWGTRSRIRVAFVLNPFCPPDVGVPTVGLLSVTDLRRVVREGDPHPRVRAAAEGALAARQSRRLEGGSTVEESPARPESFSPGQNGPDLDTVGGR